MTYEELVKKVETAYAKADASAVAEHVAVQFNITGEGEGALYLEVADGKIDIQPFEYYDRDAIITTTADTLADIASGKLLMVDAYTNGQLFVDGNLEKVSLLKDIVIKKTRTRKAAEKTPAKKAPAKKEAAPKAEKKTTAKKAEAAKAEATKTEAAKKTPAKKAAKSAK
jgi:putative sterol carrier protein